MLQLVIIILWLASVLLTMEEYVEYFPQLKRWEFIFLCFIFFIGGPFFLIANALGNLVELIIGEDINDDHLRKF